MTDDLKLAIDELKNYRRHMSREIAKEIRDTLMKEADEAFDEFYNSYQPRYYKRHVFDSYPYHNIGRTYKPFYKRSTISRGGIEIFYDDMEEIYQQQADKVADTMWAGFHGPPIGHNASTPRMWPSPIERIKNKRDELSNNANLLAQKANDKVFSSYKFNFIKKK